jgi:hypothetical protein
MGKIALVVTSTPRSGTGWTHRAMYAAGIPTGHETHFVYWLQRYEDPARQGLWGDSSWLAAPFLPSMPDGTTVVHLVRNPLETVASLVSLGHFDDWSPGKNGYKTFMQRHMPGGMPEPADAVARAAWFWASWHAMIDLHLASCPHLRPFRGTGLARLEEAAGWLPELYRLVAGRDASPGSLKAALATGRYNDGRGEKPSVAWDMLPPMAAEMARRYGYGPDGIACHLP